MEGVNEMRIYRKVKTVEELSQEAQKKVKGFVIIFSGDKLSGWVELVKLPKLEGKGIIEQNSNDLGTFLVKLPTDKVWERVEYRMVLIK